MAAAVECNHSHLQLII